MKNIIKMGLLSVISMFAISAYAIPITGTAQYVGATTPTGGIGTFATATGLSFLSKGTVILADGGLGTDFFDGTPANAVITLFDFNFDVQPGVGGTTLWTMDTTDLAFKLTTVSIEAQGPGFLNLSGTGLFSATGYDDTVAMWDFSTQSLEGTLNPQVSFSASSSANEVPAPATIGLIGIGLLGLRIARKQKSGMLVS